MVKLGSISGVLIGIWMLVATHAQAAVWQWSVSLEKAVSSETDGHPTAFLWIPENCKQVKGIVVGMHNMLEEGIMEHVHFRKVMTEIGFAQIWITPGLDPLFDPKGMSQVRFDEMLQKLGQVSGYEELEIAPIVPIGHSAYASYPWNFAAWNPDKTLAVISVHGDAPQTNLTGCGRPNLDWGDRNTNGIPGLMVMGEYEWWEDRLTPAIRYKNSYPDAAVSLLADAGYGHFDYSDNLVEYLALFIKKAEKYRLTSNYRLKPVMPKKGWLVDRWHKDQNPNSKAAPYMKYGGNKQEAFWYFDKEMAHATEQYYARARKKVDRYLGVEMNGALLYFNEKNHARYALNLKPDNEQLTFQIKGVFTDSSRTRVDEDFKKEKVGIDIICGSAIKVNDSTFAPRFYHLGMDNKKRSNTFWLKAHHLGTKQYKSTVQQVHVSFPYPLTDGTAQHLTFPAIADVDVYTKSIPLDAKSDSGLPVFYYVKVGPAIIKDNVLLLQAVPPKAAFPVKVTVVAWQYGNSWSDQKIQSAIPVEHSFYIHPRR